jgi:outer membrane protein assembly factor BamB
MPGSHVFFCSDDEHCYSVDQHDGRLLWRTSIGTRLNSSPTVSDGIVYFGDTGGTFYALDAATGDVRWASDEVAGKINCDPTVVDGVVYVGDLRGSLHAFDAASGDHHSKY